MPDPTPRLVRIATVQPMVTRVIDDNDPDVTSADAFKQCQRALADGADLVVLPEMVNVIGLGPSAAVEHAARAEKFLRDYLRLSSDYPQAWLVVPVFEQRGSAQFNCAVVIADGRRQGHYDKVHLAIDEAVRYPALEAGSGYPLFRTPFGTFGVMICFDGQFPEVARQYACAGADIVCYPAWQSGPSEATFDVQLRSRAVDNMAVVVRSSYGYADGVAWEPGMFFGRSSIIDRDGTVLADVGHRSATATTTIDLARPVLMQVADDGSNVQDLQQLIFTQRRPDTYRALTEPVVHPAKPADLMDDGRRRAENPEGSLQQ